VGRKQTKQNNNKRLCKTWQYFRIHNNASERDNEVILHLVTTSDLTLFF